VGRPSAAATASGGLPVVPRCRVVVDNDFAGDPDGLLALAHHLLSPAERVDLVTSSFLNPVFASPLSAAVHGARLAGELLDLLGAGGEVPVVAGADQALDTGDASSAAADAIVEHALRDDPLPLFLVCAGPLTNVAQALRQAPDLAERLTLVWVGGSVEGAEEYNRDTDPAAADVVLGHRDLAVWRFPVEVYRRCVVSVAELQLELTTRGPVGAWLWERFVALVDSLPDGLAVPAVWALGDSLPLVATSLAHPGQRMDPAAASPGTGERLVAEDADPRLLWADLLARLELLHRG
jgi:purine nucleosidase